jgi:hypothetical protein
MQRCSSVAVQDDVNTKLYIQVDMFVRTCYLGRMGRSGGHYSTALVVLGTREFRDGITKILGRFRRLGSRAEPVFLGPRRKPEAVLLPYSSYADMIEELENAAIVRLVEERLPAADAELGTDLDEVARELGFDPDEIFVAR